MRTCSLDERDAARCQRTWLIEVGAVALILLLAGAMAAIPGWQWAEFGLGLGATLLAKNLVRHLNGFRMRRIELAGGGGAFAAGLAGMLSPELPLLATFLIVTGAVALGSVLLEFGSHR